MKRIIRLCKTLRKGALRVNEHHTENLTPFFTTKYGHTRFDGFMLIRYCYPVCYKRNYA